MAKKINHGKRFESDFIKSVPDRCDVTRLKDGGGWGNATNMRFTSKNPCDFIVFSGNEADDYGSMYKLELKSVAGKSLPFSNIKDHQLDSMVESGQKNVFAWFVINFRGVDETYWIPAQLLKSHIETCGRKSLSLENAKTVGHKITQTKKITRWRYDLEWL